MRPIKSPIKNTYTVDADHSTSCFHLKTVYLVQGSAWPRTKKPEERVE